MIDARKWFIVVQRAASEQSGMTVANIRKTLCRGRTESYPIADHYPGQPTTIEDDGNVCWTVTRSNKLAPDGEKKLAFVVGAKRHAKGVKHANTHSVVDAVISRMCPAGTR